MEKEILIFGHKNPDTDSICSAMVKERLNKKNGYDSSVAVRLGNINKETQYVLNYLNLEAPELKEEVAEGQKVIMVDHNEFNQSIKGIEKAKILGVVDHHRIANFETSDPLYDTARPYGCTSTILFQDFKGKGIEINREEAILMASAIISDTLLLKSPTTTKHDEKALEELDKNGIKFVIGQVNTVDIPSVLERQEELEKAIEEELKEKELALFVLAITDILNSNSEILALGEKSSVVEKAFDKKLENNRAFLEGVVSRKKQLLPNIDKNI